MSVKFGNVSNGSGLSWDVAHIIELVWYDLLSSFPASIATPTDFSFWNSFSQRSLCILVIQIKRSWRLFQVGKKLRGPLGDELSRMDIQAYTNIDLQHILVWTIYYIASKYNFSKLHVIPIILFTQLALIIYIYVALFICA